MRLKLPFTARSAGSSLALVVSASLLLSACDGSGSTPTTSASPAPVVTETETANPVTTTRTPSDAAPSPTTSEPTGSESTNSPSPTALPPLGSPSMDQKQQAQVGDSDMSIAGIRVAEHETFTRVPGDPYSSFLRVPQSALRIVNRLYSFSGCRTNRCSTP